MATMTIEERERRAYADGRVEEAALLAVAVDGDDEARERIDYLEDVNHQLQRQVDDLEDELTAR